MKRNTSIKLKAAFLLVVFALNTVVGFACAIGIDMGFNKHHHHGDETTEVNATGHHHEEEVIINHNQISIAPFENCCSQKVTQLAQADKAVPNSVSIIHPIFFIAFLSAFYNIDLLHHPDVIIDNKHFVRSYHPPIPDIRIAIRSFQI